MAAQEDRGSAGLIAWSIALLACVIDQGNPDPAGWPTWVAVFLMLGIWAAWPRKRR